MPSYEAISATFNVCRMANNEISQKYCEQRFQPSLARHRADWYPHTYPAGVVPKNTDVSSTLWESNWNHSHYTQHQTRTFSSEKCWLNVTPMDLQACQICFNTVRSFFHLLRGCGSASCKCNSFPVLRNVSTSRGPNHGYWWPFGRCKAFGREADVT
jgi:hypothetical protein